MLIFLRRLSGARGAEGSSSIAPRLAALGGVKAKNKEKAAYLPNFPPLKTKNTHHRLYIH